MPLLAGLLLVASFGYGQTRAQHKSPPKSTQEAAKAKKPSPTLGFERTKGVSPILDLGEDAFLEEKSPNNEFLKEKRVLHEAVLLNEFVESFQDSKECNGIALYLKSGKKPDFLVHIGVSDGAGDKSWTWILLWPADPSPPEGEAHGIGGMGNQSTATLTARDVCRTVWDDVDPNHFKKPGGKID